MKVYSAKQVGEKRAFTLVELLVVISIIALLLSILMPSLQKARKQAQSVVCMSKLKQLGLATSTYTTDNSNVLPPAEWNAGNLFYWDSFLNKYLGSTTSWTQIKQTKYFSCPSASSQSKIGNISIGRTYGMNTYLHSLWPSGGDVANPKKFKITQLPSDLFLIGDSRLDVPSSAWWSPIIGPKFSWDLAIRPYYMYRAPDIIHNGSFNFVKTDGSVKKVAANRAFDNKWPPTYKTADVKWIP